MSLLPVPGGILAQLAPAASQLGGAAGQMNPQQMGHDDGHCEAGQQPAGPGEPIAPPQIERPVWPSTPAMPDHLEGPHLDGR
jgi:hypothetical protein